MEQYLAVEDETDEEQNKVWVKERFLTIFPEKTRKCLAPNCPKVYKASVNWRTMKSHWKNFHQGMAIPQTKFALHDELWNHLLVKFIVLGNYPFSLADDPHFNEFCAAMDSSKRTLSSKSVSESVKNGIVRLEPHIKKVLKKQPAVSVTSDIWSSKEGSRSYGSVTARFIDEEMDMKELILNFEHIPYPHDGQAVADFLASSIEKFGIQKKIISITTDNVTDDNCAIRILKEKYEFESNFGIQGGFHRQCMEHIINLGLQDSLDCLTLIVAPVDLFVKFIASSARRKERFAQIQLEVSDPQKPLLENVRYQWKSTLLMLQRAYELRKSIDKALLLMETPINRIDWQKVNKVIEFLKPFYEITLDVNDSSEPSTTLMISDCSLVTQHLDKYINNGPSTGGDRMEIENFDEEFDFDDADQFSLAAEAFSKKWSIYDKLLITEAAKISSFLDPRIKLSFLETKTEQTQFYQYMRQVIENLTDTPTEELNSNDSIYQDIFIKETENEIDRYISAPRQPRETKILQYWKISAANYPRLSKLARIFLCSNANIAPSERLFSAASLVDAPSGNRLATQSFKCCMMLRSWLMSKVLKLSI